MRVDKIDSKSRSGHVFISFLKKPRLRNFFYRQFPFFPGQTNFFPGCVVFGRIASGQKSHFGRFRNSSAPTFSGIRTEQFYETLAQRCLLKRNRIVEMIYLIDLPKFRPWWQITAAATMGATRKVLKALLSL